MNPSGDSVPSLFFQHEHDTEKHGKNKTLNITRVEKKRNILLLSGFFLTKVDRKKSFLKDK